MNVSQNVARVFFSTVLLISLAPAKAFAGFDPTTGVDALDPSPYIRPDGSLELVEGISGSLDLTGWDVRLDNQLGPLLQPATSTLGAWTSLGGAGTGLDNDVYDIEIYDGVIYAGGAFGDAGGDPDADFIAKFEGGAWSSLGGAGTGLNNQVHDIEISGGVLYAGGFFTDAGGDPDADFIAKFESGAWSSLGGAGTGLSASVNDIEISGGVIYAGGNFSNAGGDADADKIAKFQSGAWSSLGGAGTGLNSAVQDIEISGGVLYAAGSFFDAGGDSDADYIAKFESGAWSPLGGAAGLNSFVFEIEISEGVIYAGGLFTDAGGDPNADGIAKFESGAWSSLGGAGSGLNGNADAIRIFDGVVYAGGGFTDAGGDAEADHIAKFSGGAWSSLGGTGLSSDVSEILISGNVLYGGGSFLDAGGDADADYIAQFGLPSAVGGSNQQSSQEIASSGTTTFYFQRAYVSVPATAIPPSETNCKIVVTQKGDSGNYGFELDDTVWDVKIVCDSGKVTLLFAPISVCIRPKDGVTTNKQVFHNHGGGFTALASTGEKSGYVCGQTQTLSLFTLGSVAIPETGFAQGEVTHLPAQPAELTYTASDLMLTIPSLALEMDIVGVPQGPNGWDVTWLGNDAGYLHGTAFPTMAGNTVLTAHVWNASNTPGPFAELDELQYGDRFSITAWGSTFTYEVRSNSLVSPNSIKPLAHEDYDWVTLITCQYFDESTGEYALRRVVRAVLVSVE